MEGLSTSSKFHQVSRDQLNACEVPAETNTFQPVHHGWLCKEVVEQVERRGYRVVKEDLRTTDNGDEFFGILRLRLQGVDSNSPWDLSLGIRNTNNKRASVGLFLGTNVWLCDNLQFSAEHTFTRKHHAGTYDVLREGIEYTTSQLMEYRSAQRQFIIDLQKRAIHTQERDHLLVNCVRAAVIKPNDLLGIIAESTRPSVDNPECENLTAWGLYNAITYVNKGGFQRNPETASRRSLSLNTIF